MADIIVILILLAITIPVVCYIVREKKKGRGCIGCPYASGCSGGCHCNDKDDSK